MRRKQFDTRISVPITSAMHRQIDDGLAAIRDHAPETFKERADFIRLSISFTLRVLGFTTRPVNVLYSADGVQPNEVDGFSRTIDTECR